MTAPFTNEPQATSDAPNAFTFLNENIPQWLADLNDINAKVFESASAVSANPSSSDHTPESARWPKNTETIHTEDLSCLHQNTKRGDHVDVWSDSSVTIAASAEPSSPDNAPTFPQAPCAVNKTMSLLPNRTGGRLRRSKSRHRIDHVVWYDSRIQKAFEQLIRNMSTGRNKLREDKTTVKLMALADEVADEDEGDGDEDIDHETYLLRGRVGDAERLKLPPWLALPHLGPPAIVMDVGEGDWRDRFSGIDGLLKSAQDRCEDGAHRVLREGNCREHIKQVQEKLREALKRSTREVELLETVAKKPSEAPHPRVRKDFRVPKPQSRSLIPPL